jgi:hypothetical protein
VVEHLLPSGTSRRREKNQVRLIWKRLCTDRVSDVAGPVTDRRRGERFEVISPVLGSLTIETPIASDNYTVELVELGEGGALVASGGTVEAGQSGWFAAVFRGAPFSTRVDIRRVETRVDADGRPRQLIALRFADMAGEKAASLRRFLGL